MTLHAQTQVAVHIGKFRNVDLFHQGIYHLRCRVFQEHDDQEFDAVPHVVSPKDLISAGNGSKSSGSPADVSRGLLPATVVESEAAFCTRSFVIRYCEEEVNVNDIAQFRIEQDANIERPLTLEMKLMFLDMQPFGGPEAFDVDESIGSVGHPHYPSTTPDVSEADFIPISTQLLRLHGTLSGLHGYYPVVFDELHFCQTDLMVHTSLLDFRLRLLPNASLSPYVGGNVSKSSTKCAAPLEEALVILAQEAELCDGWYSNDHGNSGKDEGASELAHAVDIVQRSYVGRLVGARERLIQVLEQTIAAEDPATKDPHIKSVVKELIRNVAPIVLPGSEGSSSPSKRIQGTLSATSAARLLAEDFFKVHKQVLEVWQILLTVLPHIVEEVSEQLRRLWLIETGERYSKCVMRELLPASEVVVPSDREIWNTHGTAATKWRNEAKQTPLPVPAIEDLSMCMDTQWLHPILFEQSYMPKAEEDVSDAYERRAGSSGNRRRPSSKEDDGDASAVHLFVMVHGLQGNSFDMRLLKNNISLLYPKVLFLSSTINETDTEGDIGLMGKNLADEVRSFIQDWCPGRGEGQSLERLSFVAYSIGGLIVRSAMPVLTEYWSKCHCFISLSSQHLGFRVASNSLLKLGIHAAKKIRNGKVYDQLLLNDTPEVQDSFLSRLARMRGLEHFQHFVLFSSYQDQYAPFESARIEVSDVLEKDPTHGQFCVKLAHEILEPVPAERVMRLDVNFHIPETNFDSVIGRTAHIQFIECQALMRMFVHSYGYLFE